MRYVPILRPADEPGRIVYGVILGEDFLELPIHYDGGAFPCLGTQCRYSQPGKKCSIQAPKKHYISALKCTITEHQPTAKDMSDYHSALRLYLSVPIEQRTSGSKPQEPQPRRVCAPIDPPTPGIAEVLHRAIEQFTPPFRGLVFSLAKITESVKGRKVDRLVYNVRRPAEPLKGLIHEFDVAPYLENIFGMRLWPDLEDEATGEPPDVIKFPFRKAE